MDPAQLRLNGQDVKVRLLKDGQPVGSDFEAHVESTEFGRKITQHEDKVMGADFDQLDQRVRGVTFRVTLFVPNNGLVTALETVEDARIARTTVPKMSIAFLLKKRDGGFTGFGAENCIIKWDWTGGGSDQRTKLNLNGMGEKYVNQGA